MSRADFLLRLASHAHALAERLEQLGWQAWERERPIPREIIQLTPEEIERQRFEAMRNQAHSAGVNLIQQERRRAHDLNNTIMTNRIEALSELRHRFETAGRFKPSNQR